MTSEDYQLIRLLTKDLQKANQALAACAYWAAGGLHHTSDDCNCCFMLENILKESDEYAEREGGCDNNIMLRGKEYTYTPVGGWPEPEKERM